MASKNTIIANLYAAQGAAWNRRWQNGANVDLIDQSIGPDGFYALDSTASNEMHVAGYDATDFLRIGNEAVYPGRGQITVHIYPNASLATTPIFVNPTPYPIYITNTRMVMTTAGTVAGASAKITHETQVAGVMQAAGTGVAVLNGTFDVHATAETVQIGTLAAGYLLSSRNQPANAATPGTGVIVVQPGDMLSLVMGGTLTTAAGLTISMSIAPGSRWHFVSYYKSAAGTAVTTPLMVGMRKRSLLYGAAIWQTKEATAATLILDVTKDASGTAAGAGTSMLSSTISLKGIANIYNQLALSATAANLNMISTDRVSAKISAAATELAGVLVTLAFDGKRDELQIDYNGANSTIGTNEEFFIAHRDYEVMDFAGSWETAGGTGARLAMTSETGTQTPGSGGQVLQTDNSNAGFDATGVVATPNFATLSALNTRFLTSGDRLGLKNAGTATPLAGTVVSARLFYR